MGCGNLPAGVSSGQQAFVQCRFARQVSNRAPQHLSCLEVGSGKACFLTMRAPDKWESPRFQAFFWLQAFLCSQAESTPAHLQVTQAVSWLVLSEFQKTKKGVMAFPQ